MSHYRTTPAQRAYLKRKYAEQARNVPCCDCPGCDHILPHGGHCTGFVKGCLCSDKRGLADLKEILAKKGHRNASE